MVDREQEKMTTKDGGPAYPVQYSNEADGPTVMPTRGMSMRDYFAASAPKQIEDDSTGIHSASHYAQICGVKIPNTDNSAKAWADFWTACEAAMRYRYADAMIAARESI